MQILDSDDMGKLITRVTLAVLLLFHGVHKVLHPGALDFIGQMLSQHGLPVILTYGVYIGEVVAPFMVLIGFRTRLGAALIVANMLFAIGLVHMGHLFTVGSSGGLTTELDLFYLFIALGVMFMGSGRFAVRPD